MKIPVFLSYPKPCFGAQKQFISRVREHLEQRDFGPRTLGVTDYDMDAPLKAIRRLLLESNGLITVAFRRTFIHSGTANYRTNIDNLEPYTLNDQWFTSPWAHIEPAMAYQLGLPILLLREQGVIEEGLFAKGGVGTYMPVFDANGSLEEYFTSPEWNGLIWKWEGQVRSVVDKKGNPPQLF